MQSDIVQRLLAWSPLVASGYQVPAASQTMDEAAAEITRLTETHNRNMADHGRLLWKDEAQSVCPSADICFEYGDTVRCGPCAIKLAEGAGVEPNMQLPNLPEVSRLNHENERLTEALRLQMEAKHREAAEAKLWFHKAQEWKEALRAAEEREKALRDALGEMVYETTHLSPMKANGDHDCTVKANTLEHARAALGEPQ